MPKKTTKNRNQEPVFKIQKPKSLSPIQCDFVCVPNRHKPSSLFVGIKIFRTWDKIWERLTDRKTTKRNVSMRFYYKGGGGWILVFSTVKYWFYLREQCWNKKRKKKEGNRGRETVFTCTCSIRRIQLVRLPVTDDISSADIGKILPLLFGTSLSDKQTARYTDTDGQMDEKRTDMSQSKCRRGC